MLQFGSLNLCDLTLGDIGKNFGGRSHATVKHSIKVVDDWREKINNFMTVCFIFKETSPKERVSNEENMLEVCWKMLKTSKISQRRNANRKICQKRFKDTWIPKIFSDLTCFFSPFSTFNKAYYYYCPFLLLLYKEGNVMNFTVSQSSLQTALDIVMKGIGSNPSLPILSGVYLKVQEELLRFNQTILPSPLNIKWQLMLKKKEKRLFLPKFCRLL